MVDHSVSQWEAMAVETVFAGGYGASGTRLLPNLPRTSSDLTKVPYMAEDAEMGYVTVDRLFLKPAGANKLKTVTFAKGLEYAPFKRKQYFHPANLGCAGLTFLADICGTKLAGETPQSYVWHWDAPTVGEFDVLGCVISDYLLEIKPGDFPYETMEFYYYDAVYSYYQGTAVDYDDNQPNTFDDFTIAIDGTTQEFTNLSFHVARKFNDENVGGRFQKAQPYIINEEIEVKVNFRTDSHTVLGDMKPVSGYQEVLFGAVDKALTDDTGLTGATQYYFKINTVEYSITTPAGTIHYDDLLALLNTATASPGAQWSLVGGDLRCTSSISTGAIALAAGVSGASLFATLTDYSALDTAVAPSQAITTHSLVITINANGTSKTITMAAMTLDPKDLTINKLKAEIDLYEYAVTFKNGGATTKVYA